MTQSLEDYLKTISLLSDEGDVRVTDIAARMGVSKPSALAALKNLETRGLLTHERYSDVVLTSAGRREAARIRETHFLLTVFLRDILRVSGETAEKDGCKMEHFLADETLDRMKEFLQRQTKGEPVKYFRPSFVC